MPKCFRNDINKIARRVKDLSQIMLLTDFNEKIGGHIKVVYINEIYFKISLSEHIQVNPIHQSTL